MYKKTLSAFVVLLSLVSSGIAQSYQRTGFGISLKTSALHLDIQFYGPGIVRVIKYPVTKTYRRESYSIIAAPVHTKINVKQNGSMVSLQTRLLSVIINTTTSDISYYSANREKLLEEKESGSQFTPFDDAGNNTYTVSQSFLLDKDEAIYGLGQQQAGRMAQRNLVVKMIQGNTEDYIPFFQSAKGYGIFWDNYSPTIFSDTTSATTFKSEVGDAIDYYFMYGGNADSVIACMRELTGRVPMFPLWTFGYWQSKERYKSQDEILDVVKKYRALKVPLDGIIQDWQYWGNNYLWNAMEFLNADFPNPQKMVNDIHGLKAHIAISIWNSFGPQTKQYRELDRIGALMNFKTWPESGSDKWPPNPDYPSGVKVYDPYNPAARDIYSKYLQQGLLSLGIDAWWMDSSEPDHFQPKTSDFDQKTYAGTFRKVRNAFPLMTVGGVYQHQRATDSSKRIFILTRSAFAGQQRYGANTWSGDVVASWKALRNQISAGLNFSLCGIPYWNSDIGGFFLWQYPHKLLDADYRELYVRWLQFGTFCPMMRSHGTDAPREIYQFGNRGDRVYDAIEKYINLRYRLLPYIYASSWDITANHSSMMRALMMDFAYDKKALNINDEFLFGKSLLVSPVTEAMYNKPSARGKDAPNTEEFTQLKSKSTYLPSGADWYDFWSGEKLTGGQHVTTPTPIDIIPLYVKAGSILPLGPIVQYAEEKKWDSLEIRIYPGADGSFVLYEDENDNYNYEKGAYSIITFDWNNNKKTLTISDRNGTFPGMLAKRVFNVVLVGLNKGNGDNISIVNDKTINYAGRKVVTGFE